MACILRLDFVIVVSFVFGRAEIKVIDLSFRIMVKFFQADYVFLLQKHKTQGYHLFLALALLIPIDNSQDIHYMLSVHVELDLFLLQRGTAVQPCVVYDLWRIIKWLEDLRTVFVSFCIYIQRSERLLSLKGFVFTHIERNFSKTLFVSQVAECLKYLASLLKLNNQKLSIFLQTGVISDSYSWINRQNGITIFRIDKEAYLLGLAKVDEIERSFFFVVEQYFEES